MPLHSIPKYLDLCQGFFLDRIRFPSPAFNPAGDLGCFCPHCRQQAAAGGLDLEELRRALGALATQVGGPTALVEGLLSVGPTASDAQSAADSALVSELLKRFLAFRSQSVTAFVARLTGQLRAANMEIGLDCFSPCLVRMVGQDLANL